MINSNDDSVVFKPDFGNLIAGVVLAIALVAGGLAIAYHAWSLGDPVPFDQGEAYARKGVIIFGAIVAPMGGLCMLIWMAKLLSHRVEISEQGLSRTTGLRIQECRWDEIELIQERISSEALPLLQVPSTPLALVSYKTKNHKLIIRPMTGPKMVLTVNNIGGIARLRDILFAYAQTHEIPWELREA